MGKVEADEEGLLEVRLFCSSTYSVLPSRKMTHGPRH